jgi:hypothetical protein
MQNSCDSAISVVFDYLLKFRKISFDDWINEVDGTAYQTELLICDKIKFLRLTTLYLIDELH